MKNLKKILAIVLTMLMAFSVLTATSSVASAALFKKSVTTSFVSRLSLQISSFFENLFGGWQKTADTNDNKSQVIKADDASDFALAKSGDTITVTRNIKTTNLKVSTATNIDLKGYTVVCDSFDYETDSSETLSIKNGRIVAKNGDIDILAPKATVKLEGLALAIADGNTQEITIDASKSTVILDGTFSATQQEGESANINIPGETRVTLSEKIISPVKLVVAGNDVKIENSSNVSGNAVVVSDESKSDVAIVNSGLLSTVEVRSADKKSGVSIENSGTLENISILKSAENSAVIDENETATDATPSVGSTPVTITNSGMVTSVSNDTQTVVSIGGVQPSYTSGNVFVPWDGVTKTAITPVNGVYNISNAAELAWVSAQVNSGAIRKGAFLLTADIDLNSQEWTPIGTSSRKLAGTFDGANHKIKNLKITREETDITKNKFIGLFGCADNFAVRDLTIENADISGYMYVSAVVGSGNKTIIKHVNVIGEVSVKGAWYCGALLGYGYAELLSCIVNVSDSSTVTASGGYVGGMAGYFTSGKRIVIDGGESNISVAGCYSGVGGLTGVLNYGNTIRNATCSAVIYNNSDGQEGFNYTGGICGAYEYYKFKTGLEYVATLESCSFTGAIVYGELFSSVTSYPMYGCAVNPTYEGTIVIK